jgi:hypothetical protein
MAFLNQIARSASVFIGITAPKPEQERRFGLMILLLTGIIIAGSVALFLVMTRVFLH